ncbi:MAG: HAD family hydrolase [Gammaproteobacteria bacterium]
MPPRREIKYLTFDLDDTLWPCAPVIEKAEQALHVWFEENYPLITGKYSLEALREQRAAVVRRYPELRHDFTSLRKLSLAALAEEFGYPESLAEAAIRVFRQHRNQVEFFEDALPTIERLKKRYLTGVITNGNADVRAIGIDGYFDVITYAAKAGAAKPDGGIFEAAVSAAGVAPEETVHIGDDPETDMLGAARAGMLTVWINPAQRPWPGGQIPDAVIGSLGELEPVLQRWSAGARVGAQHKQDRRGG